MRLHLLPASLLLTLVTALALTGCSNDSTSGTTKPSASASGTPSTSSSPPASASTVASTSPAQSPTQSPSTSPSPSAPAPLPHDRLAAASYHESILVSSAASTPEEHAVVNAWMSYWNNVADTYFNGHPTADLAKVASGDALAQVHAYLEDQKRKNERAVGWAKDHVLSVNVTGDRATVHDCTENFTFSVDEEGDPATRPDPWYDATGTLEKQQGSWVVVHQTSKKPKTSCLP
jgi:hypothetical protein